MVQDLGILVVDGGAIVLGYLGVRGGRNGHRSGVGVIQTFGVARLVEKTITGKDTEVVKRSPVKIDVDLACLRGNVFSHGRDNCEKEL